MGWVSKKFKDLIFKVVYLTSQVVHTRIEGYRRRVHPSCSKVDVASINSLTKKDFENVYILLPNIAQHLELL